MADREIQIPEIGAPFRTGRHVRHDERSKAFMARRATVRRTKMHRHFGPTLDQGRIGSCTGNALVQDIMCWPLREPKEFHDQEVAQAIYSRATEIDPWAGSWRPDDTGSSGLAACKAAQERGLIAGYDWCFGLEHTLDTLTTSPVMIGTNWYESMFYPDAAGMVHASGKVAGGHEYVLNGIDIRRKLVRGLNSWGPGWSLNGYFWMTWDTLDRLLSEQGDVIALRR